MIAACYLRKSTDEGEKSEDAKSVTRQLERAREFAIKKGWTFSEGHVYADDGVSGAAFNSKERPGFFRLLDALSPRPPFNVLIVSELSRLGRDTIRTMSTVQDLLDSGVRLFTYLDDKEVTLSEASDEIQLFMPAWASSQERKKGSQRTRDALRRKAEAGYVTGGRTYGYTSRRTGSHVVWEINPIEARVVVRIFNMIADGNGFLRIAKLLNAEGIPSPSRRGWAATTIHCMAYREMYRGRRVFGRRRAVRQGGKRKVLMVTDGSQIVREQPELRLVNETLWIRAHARLDRTRKIFGARRRPNGQLAGRPESGLISRHLLVGFLRCGLCQGSLFFHVKGDGARARKKTRMYYSCSNRHKAGTKFCKNRWGVPYEAITAAVLSHFQDQTVDIYKTLLQAVWTRQRQETGALQQQRVALESEIARLGRELDQLAEAVATTKGEIPALLSTMRAKQAQKDEATARLAHLSLAPPADLERVEAAIERDMPILLLNCTRDLRGALEAGGPAGRQVLRDVLVGPVIVTPETDGEGRLTGWNYLGEMAFDGVLAGKLGPAAPVITIPKDLAGIFRYMVSQFPTDPVRDEEGASGVWESAEEAQKASTVSVPRPVSDTRRAARTSSMLPTADAHRQGTAGPARPAMRLSPGGP